MLLATGSSIIYPMRLGNIEEHAIYAPEKPMAGCRGLLLAVPPKRILGKSSPLNSRYRAQRMAAHEEIVLNDSKDDSNMCLVKVSTYQCSLSDGYGLRTVGYCTMYD